MSHDHSPEDDVACTACETEGSRSRLDDGGLCPDCRTPAGRLVTALAARGVEDVEVAPDGRDAASVGCLTIDVDEDGRWAIDGHDADGITAADAIAAIVRAQPTKRTAADDAVCECFGECVASLNLYSPAPGIYHLPDHGGILHLFAERWTAESDPESDERPWESLSAFVEASDDYRKSRALRAERDTLAARVAALEAENARLTSRVETFAGALLSLGAL